MESALLSLERGYEDEVYTQLHSFNEVNKIKFKLEENVATRESFCNAVLDQLSSRQWLPRTQAAALISLRIAAREKTGVGRLRSEDGLKTIVQLSDLSHDIKESSFQEDALPADRVQVVVEAVKCLCNLILTDHSLAIICGSLGTLHGLSLRLRLVRNLDLPPDVLTFDLRLLFLITACAVSERSKFRDSYKGLTLLVTIIDAIIFGRQETGGGQEVVTTETSQENAVTVEPERVEGATVGVESSKSVEESSKCVTVIASDGAGVRDGERDEYLLPLPPLREGVWTSPTPLNEVEMGWVSEAMKVVFNQTVHWKEERDFDEDDLVLLSRIVVLVRIILVSIPFQLGKVAVDTVIHSTEVLVNTPLALAKQLLLPTEVQIMPTLRERYPDLCPPAKGAAVAGGNDEGHCGIHDETFEEWNMIVCTRLLELLTHSLDSSSSLSTILTVLRSISKGHRDIRRFFKSKILPPLREVTQRPEQEDSLKGRLVRLMTVAGGGAEGVAAEFLFVLCKEDSTRLIKYTGYGNAAGLLLSHGLLGGGKSENIETEYSSDSESDTEDYIQSKPSIDPVTGGPSVVREEGREGEEMTEEEKEREAVKLVDMMKRLNEHGVIRVMPMDSQQHDILSEDLPLD